MKRAKVIFCLLLLFLSSGCQIEEIETEINEDSWQTTRNENDLYMHEEFEYNSSTLTNSEFLDLKQSFIEMYCNDGCVISLTADGNVVTWGNNSNGKIGNGKIDNFGINTEQTPVEPVLLDFKSNISKIGASGTISYALTDCGDAYIWGSNIFGESGIASGNILEPQKIGIKAEIKKIACGYYNNLFLTANGEVFISGVDVLIYDNVDDLNDNLYIEYNVEDLNKFYPSITAEPGYIKVDLPFKCVDISIGLLHHCFLSEEGEVYMYGTLLGSYDRENENLTHEELYKVNFPEKITAIESSSNYIVALSKSGKMYLYGQKEGVFYNEECDDVISDNIFLKGCLENIVSINSSLYCTFAVDYDGNAWGFGIDNWGVIDNKNCDEDASTYEIISQPRKLNYSNVTKCVTDCLNTVIITKNKQSFIQGADGMKQISFLDY